MHFRPPFKWIALALGLIGLSGWGVTAEINSLEVTDSSNTARFAEGVLAGLTNDNLRALEGLLARGFKDTIDGVLTSTGTSTALNVTSNRTGVSTLYTGLSLRFLAHTSVGSAPTFSFNSVSAARLSWPNGNALKSAHIAQYEVIEVVYSDNKWRVIGGKTQPLASAFTSFSTYSALSNAILSRSSAPTSSSGKQIMEVAIVPTNAGNNIRILATVNMFSTQIPACALYQDSDALAFASAFGPGFGGSSMYGAVVLSYVTPAGSASSRTYKVRCGQESAGTLLLNGSDVTEDFGDTANTSLTVQEVAP